MTCGTPFSVLKLRELAVGQATSPVTSAGGGGHAERAARRGERRRHFRVPTDYLRARQESRERRRRREMVRRNVRWLFSIHKSRKNDRVLSAMMARQATLEPVAPPAAGDGGAAASKDTAAPSLQDPELGEMLMELSFKD